MADSIRVWDVIPASPERVFTAWLDGAKHSAFTGARATVDGVSGTYTAWDGYIHGTTFEAEPHHRIVQSWRTTAFPPEAPPSRLEILLEAEAGGTRITLVHTEIPEGQGSQYEQGWKEHYFAPMKHYFGSAEAVAHPGSPVAKPAAKAKPKKKVKPAAKKAAPRASKKKAAAGKKKAARKAKRRG